MTHNKLPWKKVSVLVTFLLNGITLGWYSIYWYFSRTRALYEKLEKPISQWAYVLLLLCVVMQAVMFFSESPLNWILTFAIPFAWSRWLLNLLEQHWGYYFGSNTTLRNIHTLLFGNLYLQYKTNQIHRAQNEDVKIIADGKWFNRIIFPVYTIVIVALVLRVAVLNWYHVPTSPMAPTIIAGDRVLMYRLAYSKIEDVKKGDVIIYKSPADPSLSLVSRVTGLPGDIVKVGSQDVEVSTDQLAVTGDNPEEVSGSINYGTIPYASIKGKAVLVLFNRRDASFSRFMKALD